MGHRFFGYSVEDSVRSCVQELELDAVGLWQIIPSGRYDFGLSGQDLVEFARKHVIEILKAGAQPVYGVAKGPLSWMPENKYGENPEEITNAIIEEWMQYEKDPKFDDIWFAKPHVYLEPR